MGCMVVKRDWGYARVLCVCFFSVCMCVCVGIRVCRNKVGGEDALKPLYTRWKLLIS